MEASTDLHQLIHSMSRSEKRYFKLFAQMQGKSDNNYIQLFDAINKQKAYDEEALKRKFAKSVKQFGSTKFFLYKLVLKSLRMFHSEDSMHYVLANQLREADLLMRRNLYGQAAKILDKCIETAEQYGLYPLLLIAYQQRQAVVLQVGRTKNYLTELEEICAKGYGVLKALEEGLRYAEVSAQFNYLTETNTDGSENSLQLLEELMQSDLLQNENQATFFESKKMFFHIHTLYAYARKDWSYMYDFAKKRALLYDAEPHRIEQDPLSYIAALHNFMAACELEGRYEEELEVLRKMREVRIKRIDVQAKIVLQSLHFELNLHLKMGHQAEARMTVEGLEEELPKIGGKIAYELLLNIHIQLAAFYLMAKDLEKTFEYLELIFGHPHILKADVTYRHALILELCYHIEAENDLLLPNKARALYRYLQSQAHISIFEQALLEVARYQLPNATSAKERWVILQSWKASIESMTNQQKELLPLLEHFDVLQWIEGLKF